MTLTLTEFLRARLDEDEQLAHDADGTLGGLDRDWTYRPDDDTSGRVLARGYYIVLLGVQGNVGAHVAAHDPRRVIDEVGAKRQALEHYEDVRQHTLDGVEAYTLAAGAVERQLKFMALPYAGHPDYRQEWRP